MKVLGYKVQRAALVLPALFLVSIALIRIEQNVFDFSGIAHTQRSLGKLSGISHPSFETAFQRAVGLINESSANKKRNSNVFDVRTWDRKTTGGLTDTDRVLLSSIYGQAESVFEYGLGESTYIADYMGVQRYAGIDSDAAWVANARSNVSAHFRFYFADIGPTELWGYPKDANESKNILNYQIAPLVVETMPFDVYMVDGRWRLPCMLISFLHASARGADPSKTTVLLHDCTDNTLWKPLAGTNDRRRDRIRSEYRMADHLLDMVNHSGALLCVYKRKPETTDAELLALWEQTFFLVQ